MSQGVTIKGKTPSGLNLEVAVDENGYLLFTSPGGGGSSSGLTDAQLRAAPVPVNSLLHINSNPVTALNPVPITGTVTASGASLNVSEALNFASQNLLTAALSQTTNITNDYQLDYLELHFTTRASRTITLTSEDGTVLYKKTNDISLDLNIPLDKKYFEGGEDITLAITQTATACSVSGKLVVAQGQLALAGSPVVTAGSFFPVRQWEQFYNIRGQRYIATTGYIQQTLNTPGETIAMLRNPSGSGQVLVLDKAEFGSTVDVRFSRYGGGTPTLIGSPVARPIGRTDGGTSTSTMQLYNGGNSSPSFTGVSVAGTLRKVAAMKGYEAYQLNDIHGTVVLQPGQLAYWMVDETPGGNAANFSSYIDFEWVEIPTATWSQMVTALQAKAEY